MATLTPKLSLRKAQDSDNARTYMVTDLGATLDILDEAATLTGTQTLSNKTLAGPSVTGNLTFSGTAQRIQGLFDGPLSSCTLLQTRTPDTSTGVYAVPNGTSQIAALGVLSSGASPDNASILRLMIDGAAGLASLDSERTGTGAYLPLAIKVGGAERVRIDTAGVIHVIAPLTSNSSTTEGLIGSTRLAFKRGATDEMNSGQIDYGQHDAEALGIVGKGATSTTRVVRIWDKLGVGTAVDQNATISIPSGGIYLLPAGSAIGTPGGPFLVGSGMAITSNATYGSITFFSHSWNHNPMFSFRSSYPDTRSWLEIHASGEVRIPYTLSVNTSNTSGVFMILSDDGAFRDSQNGWIEFVKPDNTAWGKLAVGDLAVKGFGYIYGRLIDIWYATNDTETNLSGGTEQDVGPSQTVGLPSDCRVVIIASGYYRSTSSANTNVIISILLDGQVVRSRRLWASGANDNHDFTIVWSGLVSAGNHTVNLRFRADTPGWNSAIGSREVTVYAMNRST